jgi:hypothetical protein
MILQSVLTQFCAVTFDIMRIIFTRIFSDFSSIETTQYLTKPEMCGVFCGTLR